MEAMRETWTDARLSDFAAHTDQRFDAVDQRFETLERRMDDGFNRVDADVRVLRGEMNARFERVEGRIDDLQRTMLQLGGGAIATIVVGFVGVIATQL
jgi:hypothetical protein